MMDLLTPSLQSLSFTINYNAIANLLTSQITRTRSSLLFALVLSVVWVWILCHDRRSVGQFVLEHSTHLELTARFLLLSDCCGFVDVGNSLWWEDGSVVYNCCWLSPAQSFSRPSHVGLATIFYCLRFQTSLFVASYDLQGYGGGIQPRLHTGVSTLLYCVVLPL
jgi:hypothetical protein